jgi:SAM-dependent methyltransferase
MERILEPELMDDEAQGLAYAQADFSGPNIQFLDLFAEKFPDFAGNARVLDLGCGPADILVRFVDRYPDCRCVGIDGAEAMLAPGREVIREKGLAACIELRCHCLPVAPGDDTYQVIISNSLLHHLHRPEILWQTIRECGVPGTRILIMDLFRPESKKDARRIVDTYAGSEPEILQTDFYNSLLASFRVDEVREQLDRAGLLLHCDEVSDRHLLVWGELP